MAFTFSFPTVAAYRSAKSSAGTAEIYNALVPSSSTGGTTNVARAAVSFIAELGRSVIDSVNVCVPFAEGGRPGDVLCYSSTYGYFWEKSPCSTWNADELGQTYHDSTSWPSSFVRVGHCYYRKGHTAKICSIVHSSEMTWGQTEIVSGVFTSNRINQGVNTIGNIGAIGVLAEAIYADKYYQRVWPLPRTIWDEACDAAKAGATASGAAIVYSTGETSGTSYVASGGVATITVAAQNETLTVNPADWGYDFDLWYRENIETPVPGTGGTITQLRNADGVNNDGIRNTRLLHLSANSTPAATYAINYSVNAPDFGAGKWWLPTAPECIYMAKVKPLLHRNGCTFTTGALWTSDQYSQSSGWAFYMATGQISANTKTANGRVRPVSEIYIP